MILILPVIWLAAANGFSGQRIYDVLIYSTWNVICTAAPIMVYCAFDEEYDYEVQLENPKEYSIGLSRACFNTTKLWGYWIFMAVIHSLQIVLFTFVFLEFNYMPGGYTMDYWTSGCCIFTTITIVANFEIYMMHHVHSFLSYFFIFGGPIMYFIIFAIQSYLFEYIAIYQSFGMLLSCPAFWFYILFITYWCNVFPKSITKLETQVDIVHQNKIGKSIEGLFAPKKNTKDKKVKLWSKDDNKDSKREQLTKKIYRICVQWLKKMYFHCQNYINVRINLKNKY